MSVDRALHLAANGFNVFPLHDKARPCISQWPEKATTDEAQIRAWWAQWPDALVGVHAAGLAVLDQDVKNGAEGVASLFKLELEHGELPLTPWQISPSGGRHFIFKAPHPLPNSAGRVAPGIDIRSDRGYFLDYGFDPATPLADAPDWLVAAAGRASERAERGGLPPEQQDSAADIAHAVAYLKEAPVAVAGSGGDARTFATACVLRDMGLSPEKSAELMLAYWNPNCLPPWSPEEIATKCENAAKYAQNPQGTEALASLFKPIGIKPAEPAAPNPGRFRRARPLAEINPPPMLVEGLIPQGALVALGALPGRSKSEHATGLAYAVATGAPDYLGRKIAPGQWSVVYLDLERLATTELRLAMYAHADGRTDVPVELAGGPFRLNVADDVRTLITDLQAIPNVGLVVVDALGAAIAGEDSNAAAAASAVGMALRAIRDNVGCAVLVVAHSPKSGEETIAGSVQFDAIFDVSVFVESHDDGASGNLHVKKDNVMSLLDDERRIGWERITLKHMLGEREVRASRFVAAPVARPPGEGGGGRSRGPRTTPTEAGAMRALHDATFGGGRMLMSDWTAAIAALCPDGDPAVQRTIRALLGSGAVLRDGLYVRPAAPALPGEP